MDKAITSPQRNRKKVPATTATTPASADQLIASNSENALRRAADRIVALNRRSTSHAYELGESFAEAKALVPEKKFGQWLKQFTDYTVRSAWNYISIHEHLQDYRDQLLTHAVMPTVMFALAKAPPETIRAIVVRMNAGERIRVKDVRLALETESTKTQQKNASMMDVGGPAGLRKLAQKKIEEDSEAFLKRASGILNQIEQVMALPGKRSALSEGALRKRITDDCRDANNLLSSVAAPLQPNMTVNMKRKPAKLREDTYWGRFQGLLNQMSDEQGWSAKDDIVAWLQNDAIPMFRFAVHGEAPSEIAEHDNDAGDGLESFHSYEDMPLHVQQIVDNALTSSEPKEREKLRNFILYDPTPYKP